MIKSYSRIAFIVIVEDYHDLGYICQAIQGIDLSHRELGMSGASYVGVIFSEHSPGDSEIAELLLEAKIELEDRL